ncbi:hypothetical protein C3E98_032385 [Pseudomonas sp. MWU13-2625]|nr:hypothetical protein C3E98_032385 [Pseudomonas sp. MWU13-2625]
MNVVQNDVGVSQVAAAIAEPARTRMLCALMDGHARTSTELAAIAEVSTSTASAHLAKLKEAGLLRVQVQGRHRYYCLGDPRVAQALEALMVMAEKNVGALPVLENGVVVGVISERDYARKLVLHGRSSVGTPVSAIMSSPVITVDSHQSVDTCMNIMTDHHLRHLPVVENGQLLGLLSIGDLVKEAIAEQADLIRQLEQYIRGE